MFLCVRTRACVKHCMQVMSSSFSDTHTEVHMHTNACAWASTHSHTHTEGKLNGKMFLSPQIYACLQTTPQTFFLSGGGLSQMAMQIYQIALLKLGKIGKKPYYSSTNNVTLQSFFSPKSLQCM